MKKIIALILCLLIMISVCGCAKKADPQETSANEQALLWMEDKLENNTLLSFRYDGKEYSEHIAQWEKTLTETENGWNLTYTFEGLELSVDITYNEEFSSFEWVGNWTNNGSGNSKVISDIKVLDADFSIKDAVMTTANNGGQNNMADYQPEVAVLSETPKVSKSCTGGRSTQNGWPYFDITASDGSGGVMIAIGWTGNWICDFEYVDGITNVKAGMQKTNYYMEKGETLRTPSMVLQFFVGDRDAGHNAWRQLVLSEYTPTDIHTGENMRYAPITINTWGGRGSEPLLTTMENVKKSGQYFEYQWIDAGWYGNFVSDNTYNTEWRTELGNWYYNPGYPNGFEDIDAWHEENGTGFLVWFEPGRAVRESKITAEHPEYFLPSNSSSTHLYFDYGNKEAREYMSELVIGFLDDMGCDFYRQDYNFDPAECWSLKDAELDATGKRVGVSEIMYVTGHYEFLDSILASGRMIDNCASGGRLLDIEMTKRAIPLWRTDYSVSGQDVMTVASGIRSQGANLSYWLPLHGGMSSSEGTDSEYTFRSLMATGATLGVYRDRTFANKMLSEMVYNRELMLGDYYILKHGLGPDTDAVNAGYQFYREDLGEGYLVAFRPNYSSEEYTNFVLKGLEKEAVYELKNADTDQTLTMTGEELMTVGLKVYFPRTQVGHMIYITKQ